MRVFRAVVIFAIIAYFSSCNLKPPDSFEESRKFAREIFQQNPVTLYCGCRYDMKNRIDLSSCKMSAASDLKRAKRMEWEHMMPAWNFGRLYQCWRKPICVKADGQKFKGRKCCRKINARFRKAEAELYNLWPSVGLINQLRSNYRPALLKNKRGVYGCSIAIDKKGRKMEPPDRAKGILARANLFMADHYQVKLNQSERKLFMVWHHQFPPGEWERVWAKQVEKIEGYPNPWIIDR